MFFVALFAGVSFGGAVLVGIIGVVVVGYMLTLIS
jgi:hypothetical protein